MKRKNFNTLRNITADQKASGEGAACRSAIPTYFWLLIVIEILGREEIDMAKIEASKAYKAGKAFPALLVNLRRFNFCHVYFPPPQLNSPGSPRMNSR